MKMILMILALMLVAAFAFAEGVPQTTCPVMKGSPVSADSKYVDAEGYRIYVCCGGCVNAIKADPAKYIAQMQAEGIELAKTPVAAEAE